MMSRSVVKKMLKTGIITVLNEKVMPRRGGNSWPDNRALSAIAFLTRNLTTHAIIF